MASTPPLPPRPLLIFDGDCSFCRRWIERWKHLTGEAVEYAPYQEAAATRAPSVPREEFGRAVHLVEPDGQITRAAEAVFRSLAAAGQKRLLLWLYENVPPFRWIAEKAYAFIAAHRDPIDRVDRWIVGTETRPATYQLTRAIFLRLLGLVYLIAFASMFVQIDGLVGSNGLLPVESFLKLVKEARPDDALRVAPTMLWWSASDRMLHGLCIGGIVLSFMLIAGVLPMLTCALLWTIYLSLCVGCQDFLSFQWDILLLESGFLAILIAPPLWAGSRVRTSRIGLFLLRWLLFRLMLLSGLTKLLSGDETWRAMTALKYHFESQPLTIWTSYYAHRMPEWVLRASCFIMFAIEMVVPLLYFAPRRLRILAFWLTIVFQLGIAFTGNYGFFNLLTIVLAVTLLDDPYIAKLTRLKLPEFRAIRRSWIRPWVIAPIAVALLFLTTIEFFDECRTSDTFRWPKWIARTLSHTRPFRSTNGYGLFRDMTKYRWEIIIEGSDDGQNWKEYEFKYKPGDVNRRPPIVQPHMPRLDWQMWEPFNHYGPPNWFVNLLIRLLQGQKETLALLEKNPFPDHPPRHLRAVIYDYHFNDGTAPKDEGWEAGRWWRRKPLKIFVPPISLKRQEAKSFEL